MGKGMKAGKKPKMNQNAQMAQIQAMQSKLQAAQEEIEKMDGLLSLALTGGDYDWL